jgi:hypothetical protein
MIVKCVFQISIICLLFLSKTIFAQACCTAGTPLLGSLEMTLAPKGILQLGLSLEHNSLNDVFDGSNLLFDQERERISESAILEVNYGISNRLSITGLFSYIRQQRIISELDYSDNSLTASGIGDVLLLTKYNLIQSSIFDRQDLSLGIGLKIPTGTSTLKSNGILLPADMQPGSGSWDGILWGYYSKGEIILPDLTLLSSLSYRLNGSNDRFESSAKGYSFGNEFIGSLGFNHPVLTFIDFIIMAKYRNAKQDTFGNQDIPNTGGNWVYLIPGAHFYLSNNISTRIDGEFPIYRNVAGTQLTTTFTASISLFYSLKLNEGSFK